MTAPIVVAVSGASGAVYAVRLLEVLLQVPRHVLLTISPSAVTVMRQELRLKVDLTSFSPTQLWPDGTPVLEQLSVTRGAGTKLSWDGQIAAGQLEYFHHGDFMAPIASGSALTGGMAICPCSGGTLSAVVTGASRNLIHRAADVHLKERRKLVLVPRETPLSQVQLANMLQASKLGAVVLPAMPGWYHNVQSAADLVDFIVARVLDQLGVENQLMQRWGTEQQP